MRKDTGASLHGDGASLVAMASRLTVSVGRPKHQRVMAGGLEDKLFIGKRAQEYRGLLKIQYPMEHGVVTDWDDMERIWGWVYNDGLKALSEEVSHRFGPLDAKLTPFSIQCF